MQKKTRLDFLEARLAENIIHLSTLDPSDDLIEFELTEMWIETLTEEVAAERRAQEVFA